MPPPMLQRRSWQRRKTPPAQDESHSLPFRDGSRHGKLVHADRGTGSEGRTPDRSADIRAL
jgi:hypothetical protein